jgi:hypothetical protein
MDEVERLEQTKERLYEELRALGDFRRGTVSSNYRKCGRKNCACAAAEHPGHGPQYLWNATIEGKSRARNLKLGPELDKVQREVGNYGTFLRLVHELVEVSEAICDLRPVEVIEEEARLDALKKKLRRQFEKKSRKKSHD